MQVKTTRCVVVNHEKAEVFADKSHPPASAVALSPYPAVFVEVLRMSLLHLQSDSDRAFVVPVDMQVEHSLQAASSEMSLQFFGSESSQRLSLLTKGFEESEGVDK